MPTQKLDGTVSDPPIVVEYSILELGEQQHDGGLRVHVHNPLPRLSTTKTDFKKLVQLIPTIFMFSFFL